MSATDRNTNEIEEVYRQHGPALLLFASAMSGDQSRAQDAIHQVFLKLLANGNLSRAVNKKAYLFKCVRNEMLNEANVQNRNTAFEVYRINHLRIPKSATVLIQLAFLRFN